MRRLYKPNYSDRVNVQLYSNVVKFYVKMCLAWFFAGHSKSPERRLKNPVGSYSSSQSAFKFWINAFTPLT